MQQRMSLSGRLGTLIYLTIEIQQNTQSLQESARQAVVEGDVELLLTATNDPQIWLSRTKTSLTDEERIKLSTYLFAAVRLRERDWNQYRSGVLDEDTWVSYQSGLVGMLSMPQTRKWWDYYSAVGAFPTDFSKYVAELLNQQSVRTKARDIEAFD